MENIGENVEQPRSRFWPPLLLFIGALVGFFGLAMLFLWPFMVRFVIEPYNSPSASMVPTLQVGDHFIVMKTIDRQAIERGDVVVFQVPSLGSDYVKRAIGLPGDTVQMKNGSLYINGAAVPRESAGMFIDHEGTALARYREELPDGSAYEIVETGDNSPHDDTRLFIVPAGHIFVLGDNRDNSIDSRMLTFGFVPTENVVGRVTYIFWSKDLGRIGTRVE